MEAAMPKDAPVNTGASDQVPAGSWSRVSEMQARLHRWAAADPGRRFDDLFNLVHDPVGAENLCHQAILVNDATRAIMPPDPEMIQVGDTIWQGPQWRGLFQSAVRPVGVVEVLILPQHHHQVAQVPDQGLVQQLTQAAANPPLHDRIH
jgi:hypothetical protein